MNISERLLMGSVDISETLLSAFGMGEDRPSSSTLSGAMRGGYAKFKYAGLSKHSPSHAQQKRDSKKAKNRRSK